MRWTVGRISRIFAALLVLALLGAIASSVGLVFFSVSKSEGVASSLWELTGAMLAAFVCAVVFDRGRWRAMMAIGIVSALLGWCALQPYLWLDVSNRAGRAWASVAIPLFVVAGYAMIVGTISQVRLWQPWAIRARQTTFVLITLLAAASFVSIVGSELLGRTSAWDAQRAFDDIMARTCGTLGVLTALGIITILVAIALPRLAGGERADEAPAVPESLRRAFWMTCPRCGAHEQKKTEGDSCTGCGLKITVTPT